MKKMRLDQNRAPIYEALERFRKMRVVPSDVPGHKHGRGNPELTTFLGQQCMDVDVNSMKPLDNLCHPVSVIREAEEMPGKEVHVFCTAYRERDFETLLGYADHIVFNSPRQLERFGFRAKAAGKSVGLRINPECSPQEGHEIYDPCAPGSRLGTTRAQWDAHMTQELIHLLDGLHFHTLCEQDSDALEVTLDAVEQKFGCFLPRMKWLNFGGGLEKLRGFGYPDFKMRLGSSAGTQQGSHDGAIRIIDPFIQLP